MENNNLNPKPILGQPKYNRGDVVLFQTGRGINRSSERVYSKHGIVGTIEIVDSYGTFDQNEEPSYDIMNEDETCFYKHIRESYILEYIKRAGE